MDRIDTRTTEAPNNDSPLEDAVAGRYAALSPANRFSGMMARGERLYRFGAGSSLAVDIFGRWGRVSESGREQLPYVRGESRAAPAAGESGAAEEGGHERGMPGHRTGSAGAQYASMLAINVPPPAGVDLPGPLAGLTPPSPHRSEGAVPLARQSSRTARLVPEVIHGDEAGRTSVAEAPEAQCRISETPQAAAPRDDSGAAGIHRKPGSDLASRESAVPSATTVTRLAGAGDPAPLSAREHGPYGVPTGKWSRPVLLRRLPDRGRDGGEAAKGGDHRSGEQAGGPPAVSQSASPLESRLFREREEISATGSDETAGSWPAAAAWSPQGSARSNEVTPVTKATVPVRPFPAGEAANYPTAPSDVRSAAVTRLPLALTRPAPAREIAESRGEGISGTAPYQSPGGGGQVASGDALASPGAGRNAGGQAAPGGMPEPVPGERQPSPAAGLSRDELGQVADRVYEIIEQRLVVEKERRGF